MTHVILRWFTKLDGGITVRRVTLLLIAVVVLGSIPSLMAEAVIAFNTRPVSYCPGAGGGCDGSEASLQTILDNAYVGQGVNAATSQQAAGYWMISSGLPGTIGPVITLEVSGIEGTNRLGMFSGPDTSLASFQERLLFLGPAAENNSAVITWDSSANMYVNAGIGVCGTSINCTGPDGQSFITPGSAGYINPFGFGFFLDNPGVPFKYYTTDNINPGDAAQALAFVGTVAGKETWTIAFEDINVNTGGDHDYNDFVFKVESIHPIPEPSFYGLLALGLSGLAWGAHRRRKSA